MINCDINNLYQERIKLKNAIDDKIFKNELETNVKNKKIVASLIVGFLNFAKFITENDYVQNYFCKKYMLDEYNRLAPQRKKLYEQIKSGYKVDYNNIF